MWLLKILRWILCCGEDERSCYHTVSRASEPPPPPHYCRYNDDLESLSRPFYSTSSSNSHSSPLTSSKPPPPPPPISSRTYVSNCAHNSCLPSLNPPPSLIHSSKSFASNASQNHNPSLPSSSPSPSPLPSSKPISSSSVSSSNPFPSTFASSKPCLPSISSSKPCLPSISSSKPSSSNASPPHLSLPSSNSSPTKNSSLPPSKLSATSLTSSNPLASDVSQTHFSIPSSNASPIRSDKNQLKDFEEVIKEAAVSSVSTSPKSPSNASPRETLSCTSKLADQRYEIPKHLADQIKKDIVPEVLRMPLSPSTYSDYFAALLYAEDFYIEKWSKFLLSGVTLELQRREPNKMQNQKILKDKKPFAAFEIDEIHERRPYLLSGDLVFARRSSKTTESFKGVLFRVVNHTTVLVEFGDEFHAQHSSSNTYDVSFSFNRVCLKRSHLAISAAKDSSLHRILFPNLNSAANAIHLHRNYNLSQLPISDRINHKGPLPYLVEGPLSTTSGRLSTTGTVIEEAILKIYTTNHQCRILVCSATDLTCGALTKSLCKRIPKEKLFRANAAFRDFDLVPDDVIPQSLYEGECFTCPSLGMLQTFNVITSTFASSCSLHTAGLNADHFTHILLVDASSAMEPEVVVPLASFVGQNTVVVVTGSSRNGPSWVRSDIAWRYGLERSYFKRLLEEETYSSRNPAFISHVV